MICAKHYCRVDKKRDKLERKVLDSQERAFWDVHRPAVRSNWGAHSTVFCAPTFRVSSFHYLLQPGCVNTTEVDIKKACRMTKPGSTAVTPKQPVNKVVLSVLCMCGACPERVCSTCCRLWSKFPEPYKSVWIAIVLQPPPVVTNYSVPGGKISPSISEAEMPKAQPIDTLKAHVEDLRKRLGRRRIKVSKVAERSVWHAMWEISVCLWFRWCVQKAGNSDKTSRINKLWGIKNNNVAVTGKPLATYWWKTFEGKAWYWL